MASRTLTSIRNPIYRFANMRRDTATLLLVASWMTLGTASILGQAISSGPPPGQPAPAAASGDVAAPATLMLSPQAAFDQASAPVDIIHRDVANWSDIERNALEAAQAEAKDACDARMSQVFAGDDLISYARLCDLGQEWKMVYTAATTYINSKDLEKPQLDQAYGFEVVADLNMQQWKAANSTCFAMLRAVPYGPLTDSITTMTIHNLQFAYLPDALDLLAQRQPYLLSLMRAYRPAGEGVAPVGQPPAPPSIPLHILFEHALEFAKLQQYNNQLELAAAVLVDIDQAIPKEMPPDEAIFIAADRKQYALLGTKFPELPGAAYLMSATETPLRQPNFGAVNIFLLFPPWCAQCVRQAQQIVPAMVGAAILHGGETKIYIYALLADNPPPPLPAKPAAKAPAAGAQAHVAHRPGAQEPVNHAAAAETPEKAEPPTVEEQLRKTPTLVVAPATLADFNAQDFPFLIVTDWQGIVRLMVPAAPKNALVEGGPAEQITDTILQHWPLRPLLPPVRIPPPAPHLTAPN